MRDDKSEYELFRAFGPAWRGVGAPEILVNRCEFRDLRLRSGSCFALVIVLPDLNVGSLSGLFVDSTSDFFIHNPGSPRCCAVFTNIPNGGIIRSDAAFQVRFVNKYECNH
jgi:hypothetical protein